MEERIKDPISSIKQILEALDIQYSFNLNNNNISHGM